MTIGSNKAFSTQELTLTVSPRDWCPKISVDQQRLKNSASPSSTNKHATFKVTYINFVPHSYALFELRQVILAMSLCLNAVSSCHVIG